MALIKRQSKELTFMSFGEDDIDHFSNVGEYTFCKFSTIGKDSKSGLIIFSDNHDECLYVEMDTMRFDEGDEYWPFDLHYNGFFDGCNIDQIEENLRVLLI